MNQTNTLAVLPFINGSPDPENEYFSDGITEEIINALAKIEGLRVISRTSSFYFKGKQVPLKEIAQQLHVETILEGSVRVAQNKVRISAKLIQAVEDVHIWSESWDRKLENIFDIQDEISLLIADKLREHFGHLEIADHLVVRQTENLDTYQLSLKARHYFNRWNPEDVKTSIQLYEQALKLDPNHTESHIGLADGYSFLGTTGFMDGEWAWRKSIEHTQKSLELNPKHPGVYYLLANVSFFTECDFQGAAKHTQKALNLKLNYPEVQQFMSFLYVLKGEMQQAGKHLQLALDMDPLNQETLFYKAFFLYRNQKTEEAQILLLDLLERNPKNIPAFTVLAYCYLILKKPQKALQLFEDLPADVVIPDEKLGISCLAHIIGGYEDEANVLLEKLEDQAKQDTAFQAHSYLFLAYANLNRLDDAFRLLEESLAKRSPIFLLSFSDPLALNLIADPRYAKFHPQIYPVIPTLEMPKKQDLLDAVTAEDFTQKLLKYVREEMPFLNPELSLRTLAGFIEIHPNQLSWLLNTQLQKNFNEFINQYRVNHFMTLAKDPANRHISLMGLAFESGFNSKTVFNTFFKKETGMTPSAYLKSQF